ncbi:hypothetical protein EAF00_005117 [Botryotinia globosa]|nr:hypothetical protein EAF00_005117 [Botryotinia globosa]
MFRRLLLSDHTKSSAPWNIPSKHVLRPVTAALVALSFQSRDLLDRALRISADVRDSVVLALLQQWFKDSHYMYCMPKFAMFGSRSRSSKPKKIHIYFIPIHVCVAYRIPSTRQQYVGRRRLYFHEFRSGSRFFGLRTPTIDIKMVEDAYN